MVQGRTASLDIGKAVKAKKSAVIWNRCWLFAICVLNAKNQIFTTKTELLFYLALFCSITLRIHNVLNLVNKRDLK